MIDAVVTLGSLIAPPAFDFIKKKFIKPSDVSPEKTLDELATNNPEVLPQYTEAQATLLKAKKEYFNRDVIGTPSLWVVNLRASIRPMGVILCFVMLTLDGTTTLDLATGTRLFCESVGASWFGSRLTKK